MKTPTLLASLVLIALLPACALFNRYGEIEYNNLVVEQINKSSLSLEKTATLYNESIPDVVTEQDTFELGEMETSYEEAKNLLRETNGLLDLESRNVEQQTAVQSELEVYMSAGDLYLQSYAEMLAYYGDGKYKEDITQVETLDETLHSNYSTFIEANNDLVDVLESFVAK